MSFNGNRLGLNAGIVTWVPICSAASAQKSCALAVEKRSIRFRFSSYRQVLFTANNPTLNYPNFYHILPNLLLAFIPISSLV